MELLKGILILKRGKLEMRDKKIDKIIIKLLEIQAKLNNKYIK